MTIPRHRIRLPDPSVWLREATSDADKELHRYLRELVAALQRELDTKVDRDAGRTELLLDSPNGSVYALTVNDVGATAISPRYVAP